MFEKTDMKEYFEQVGVTFSKIGSAWRANCPLCSATNALEVKDAERERWFCHACCSREHPHDLTDLRNALAGELPEPGQNGTNEAEKDFDRCQPANSYSGLREFFKYKREFPECVLDKTVEIAQMYLRFDLGYWRNGQNGNGDEKEYINSKTGFLVAPIFDPTLFSIKRNFIGTQRLSVTERKIKLPYGRFGGIFPINRNSNEVVFVESVANAIALATIDITAVCIFSAGNIGVIQPAITALKRKNSNYRFFLWLDSTRDGSQVDAHAQTALDKNAALAQVKFEGMPDGYDLNDLLVATGERFATEVQKLLRRAFAQKKKQAGIVDNTPQDFPLHVFPRWLQKFCSQTATSVNVSLDYVAPFVFPLIGAALGKNKVLRLHDDWSESARIYLSAVGEPSSGKSVAFEKLTNPLKLIESRFADRNQAAKDAYDVEKIAYSVEKEKKKAAVRDNKEYDLCPAPSPPRKFRAFTTDATVESLHGLLLDNESILLKYDEISGLISSLNAYKKGGADREYYLSCWSGADVTIDRKGGEQGTLYVKDPYLCIAGMTTPKKAHLLVTDDKGNDGMTARFIFVVPDEKASPRYSEERINETLKGQWQSELERHYMNRAESCTYQTTDEGRNAFKQAYNDLADEIDAENSDVMRSWLGKCRGYILRIALILAAVHSRTEIDAPIIVDAKQVIDYFISHARKCFALAAIERGVNKDDKDAQKQDLTQKIVKYCARRGIDSISVRTACRAEIQARLKADDVRVVFAMMVAAGVATAGHAKDSIILNI